MGMLSKKAKEYE